MSRIVHLSTVHPRTDARITRRECAALVEAGHEVHLVVADGLGDGMIDGITVHDVGRAGGRWGRMLKLPRLAIRRIRGIRPEIVHFHDPELLPAALSLRLRGYRVIYDAHEDLPRSIMSKEWIPGLVRRTISVVAEIVENFSAARMTAVVAATPVIAERFVGRRKIVETVCNYPDLSGAPKTVGGTGEPRTFCYVGAISVHRGIREMVAAAGLADAKLILAGPFESEAQLAEISAMPSWANVEYLGTIPHDAIWKELQRSLGGLLFLHPVRNYIDSLPTKMYEYMATGIPVLASDYAGWPDLVKQEKAGLTCDPLDPEAIAALMRQVIENPEEAEAMGRRGREVVMARYRWENEAKKLVDLYARLLGAPPPNGGDVSGAR